jgi:hypothetical protein
MQNGRRYEKSKVNPESHKIRAKEDMKACARGDFAPEPNNQVN